VVTLRCGHRLVDLRFAPSIVKRLGGDEPRLGGRGDAPLRSWD
jgi:hypothetical protein